MTQVTHVKQVTHNTYELRVHPDSLETSASSTSNSS